MEIKLSALEERARSSGEAYLPLLSREGRRAGLNARMEGSALVMEVEIQIRLVPPDADVDLGALHRAIEVLADLALAGFGLHHFGEGWVVAARPFTADHLPLLTEAVERIAQDAD